MLQPKNFYYVIFSSFLVKPHPLSLNMHPVSSKLASSEKKKFFDENFKIFISCILCILVTSLSPTPKNMLPARAAALPTSLSIYIIDVAINLRIGDGECPVEHSAVYRLNHRMFSLLSSSSICCSRLPSRALCFM